LELHHRLYFFVVPKVKLKILELQQFEIQFFVFFEKYLSLRRFFLSDFFCVVLIESG